MFKADALKMSETIQIKRTAHLECWTSVSLRVFSADIQTDSHKARQFSSSASLSAFLTQTNTCMLTYHTRLTADLVYLDEQACERGQLCASVCVYLCLCVCCLNIVNSSGFFFFFCSLGSLRTKVGASGKTEEIERMQKRVAGK